MSLDALLNVIGIILFIGAPLIPLLYIAIEVEHWHDLNADPEIIEPSHGHH